MRWQRELNPLQVQALSRAHERHDFISFTFYCFARCNLGFATLDASTFIPINMLFTGKGDDGNTNLFGYCDQRISKSSAIAEALGAVDEINSLLGVAKMAAGEKIIGILDQVQHDLFIVQAELAGAKKEIVREKIVALENVIQEIEQELPPIKTFFIAGGTPLAAQLDHARAVARRAERRVVKVSEERKVSLSALSYLNRLSSLLYVLARLENHKSGIKEKSPRYD